MRLRLNLLRPKNCISFITPWLLKRSELSANQTASYSGSTRADLFNPKARNVFYKSERLGNHLLLARGANENMVVSPLSLQVVLSLLAAGSHGRTRRQLLKLYAADSVDTLNYFSSQISNTILADGVPSMRCSNALWIDESLSLKPSFQHILHSDYKAPLHPLDFHTQAPNVRQQINSWVEHETIGLVQDLIDEGSLDNSVKLVFTNALYFKGSWDGEARSPFICLDDFSKENFAQAPFMTAKRKEFGRSNNGCRNLNQPYKKLREDKRSFIHHFVYPQIDTEHRVRNHVAETLMDLCGCMTPKFDISSEIEASHVLRQLGVTLPFSGGKLTEMVSSFDGQELYVFNIFQKAFMEINEQGTEAATATTAIVTSGPRQSDLPPVPKITRESYFPFLLYVGRDDYGSIHMAKTQLLVTQLFNPLPS